LVDIKMTVVSDDFEFNFSDLIPNIKAKIDCFSYPMGIIFDSIRMDDAPCIKLAKINNGTMAVLKSNFAVLKTSRN
jgi:non-specific serine/threonine protein kinase